ncbi:MAG: NRDE family protein [Candidatus Binatia bacterium]
MCTLALYFQEFSESPLIVAANRDEFFSRPSASPQVLVGDPLVFGGKDLLAGGTWLGVNQHGLLVGILNRRSAEGKDKVHGRSRGLLCLDLLRTKNPAQACEFLKGEKASTYQPFNLLFADAHEAYVAYNIREGIECIRLGKGIHLLSNASVFGSTSEKMGQAYHLFADFGRQARRGSFRGRLQIWDQSSLIRLFRGILSNHRLRTGSRDPRDAICVHTDNYGTVSSTIVFYMGEEKQFDYYHASGPPCQRDYKRFLSVAVL